MERNSIETTAKTVEEAIEIGLRELDADRDEVEIDVVSKGKTSILGIGGQLACVRVSLLDFAEDEVAGDVVRAVSGVLNTLMDLMEVDAVATIRQVSGEQNSGPIFDVDGDDSGLLIGRGGETLRALQFLVNFIASAELGQRSNAVIDVAEYQARRDRNVQNLARNAAQRVDRFGRSVPLEPMNPYERRIVHLALADNERVVTESTGAGTDRRVVVRPTDENPF